MEKYNYISKSAEDTKKLGQKIGNIAEPGIIILLSGDLGSGKTLLVKGIGSVLGINEREITSPSYTLINEYQNHQTLYHMDLYRLSRKEDLYDIGFEEYFDKEGILAIEWPEIADDLIPDEYIKLTFEIIDIEERKIEIEIYGENAAQIGEGLKIEC